MATFVRLTHPFPVLVDGLATGAVTVLAGGSAVVVSALAAGMMSLQAAIGIVNDVVDAPLDAGRKPGKPIPVGLVGPRAAVRLAVVAAATGLVLSALQDLPTLIVATLILAVGFLYDLRLKGTAWSWLPFAAGIPLLPVYAWVGATGSVPTLFGTLLPAAFCAGAALAIANAMVDVERDRDAGVSSVALTLGPRRSWWVHLVLHAAVGAIASASLLARGVPHAVVLVGVAGPAVVVGAGVALAGARAAGHRERGWELEAVGIALLAVGWLLLAARA